MTNNLFIGILFCLFCNIFCSLDINSQERQVKVVDAESAKPVDFVSVSSTKTGHILAVTDDSGNVLLHALQCGGDTLSFQLLGYETRIVAYQQLTDRVTLTPKSYTLENIIVKYTSPIDLYKLALSNTREKLSTDIIFYKNDFNYIDDTFACQDSVSFIFSSQYKNTSSKSPKLALWELNYYLEYTEQSFEMFRRWRKYRIGFPEISRLL